MKTILEYQSAKTTIRLKLGDTVRIKKGYGNPSCAGDWQDGEEFIIWKIEIEPWGTFICPNNYQTCSVSKVEHVYPNK